MRATDKEWRQWKMAIEAHRRVSSQTRKVQRQLSRLCSLMQAYERDIYIFDSDSVAERDQRYAVLWGRNERLRRKEKWLVAACQKKEEEVQAAWKGPPAY